MHRISAACWIPSMIVVLAALLSAGTPGSFRGTIVDGPPAPEKGWIYVQGRNRAVRRVDIPHAKVSYDETIPVANRQVRPQDALTAGTEVRVTAEQGSDGEWRATRVEILKRQ
jgi:hypothetical protein